MLKHLIQTLFHRPQPRNKLQPTMDAVFQRFYNRNLEQRTATHNWKPGVPYHQPYHVYSPNDKRWRSVFPPPTSSTNSPTSIATPLKEFSIYSWNIDFMLPASDARMTAALKHLESQIYNDAGESQGTSTSTTPRTPPAPAVILLQEMTSSDLRVIQQTPWVQQGYYVTDVSNEYWASEGYGTCTLIPKRFVVRSVFRVHFRDTVMERDGLFVDLEMGQDREDTCLRVCNTHLESLALQPPRRPAQMKCLAGFMRGESGNGGDDEERGGTKVLASVLGGDLNAVEPFDLTLPAENGLGDAYLVSGGEEGRDDCFTWGQMARTTQRERFGLSRMDKLLFCGAVKVLRFQTFGYGVEVEGDANREELVQQGLDRPWVTDHLGVRGDFGIVEVGDRVQARKDSVL